MRNLLNRRGILLAALTALIGVTTLGSFAAIRAETPIDEIKVTTKLRLEVKQSKLIRTKADIYRIEVVDPKICNAIPVSPREMSLIATKVGTTDITFWTRNESTVPTKIRVDVVRTSK